jgi:cysteinyl-tRNA synthetase
MHVGTVLHHGRKMAKSAGNLVFLPRPPGGLAARRHQALALIDRPWRSDWGFPLEDPAGRRPTAASCCG